MKIVKVLKCPLATAWTEQYVRLPVQGLPAGDPVTLRVNGKRAPFQYTGHTLPGGAEVLVRLGFEKGETKTLEFVPAGQCETDLQSVPVALEKPVLIGATGRELLIADPLAAIGPFPLASRIHGAAALESRSLTRVNDGALFTDYEWRARAAGNGGRYTVRLRCYRHEPIVEVAEEFSLGMNASLELTLNPEGIFDSILSRDDFEGETQPVVEPLALERPGDVLCRLQMPVLAEYFIPNNRGWFALFDSRNEQRGMLGILGLYGAKWMYPAQNMMRVSVSGGRAVLRASLESGKRHWLLYAGPVRKVFRVQCSGVSLEGETAAGGHRSEVNASASQLEDNPSAASRSFPRLNTEHRTLNTPPSDGRFIFHRLHAEFNALRLDEHLDLTATEIYDSGCWDQPGFFASDYRERAQRNAAALLPLRKVVEKKGHRAVQALTDPSAATRQALLDHLLWRFEKWVRQFQGFREGQFDFNKGVIGFARTLRGLLIDYELLRKDRFLSEAQIGNLQAYFVFAARRILDEGRWPHSKTWRHPDHPESTRDFYTYPGEHKPDRLVWTNCLPNFQSDPMCALLHLSAIIPEHPDAARWRQFALDDLDRQLDAYCGKSGAWVESINYALYTLVYFVITFRILKNRCGIDYFQDERVRRFAGWLVRFFGPFDKRFGSHTYPGIGNSHLPQRYFCEGLLGFAGELAATDPLRADLMAIYQRMEAVLESIENFPILLAVADVPDREYPLRPLSSEHMDEVGVALRHAHPSPRESYLFQKIGFAKDHYENDETAFNWYAKGMPLVMDYGTYSADVMAAFAHNLVEIPDMDALRRGYLADRFFSPLVDYTRCEVPVTLKLQYGHVCTWAEIDGPPVPPKFFYIGDENPVGPKIWKTRLLLFVKPDYVVLFDRVFGGVPHRFNLHVVADSIQRDGPRLSARGRFDLDLLGFVQHPDAFDLETGEFVPGPEQLGRGADNPHRQSYVRLYNQSDDLYRVVLFARERGREVRIAKIGAAGARITTPEYEDFVFACNEPAIENADGVSFAGRVGWIRRETSGRIRACVPDGESLSAFGTAITGRGPWQYDENGSPELSVTGVPRHIQVQRSPHS